MGDDITIGVTEIVNNIEVTAQPNDQIVDISVIDNADDVTLNITPTVIEINVNKGSSYAKWGTILGTLSDQTDLQDALDLKADLVDGKVPSSQLPSYVDDVIEVANYAALPATGETGKIYVTIDNNKIFRWTGSTYVEIIDSAAVWGAITGTLSSQTDLQNALNLKANDNAVVKLTGDQSITGSKSFTTNTAAPAMVVTNNSTDNGILLQNTSTGRGITSNNVSTGIGIRSDNTGGGTGILSSNTGAGTGIVSTNTSTTGSALSISNSSTGYGILLTNSTGTGISSSNTGSGTGFYSNNSSTGNGIQSINSSSGYGISSSNTGSGRGIYSSNNSTGDAINIANSGSGRGIYLTNASSGNSLILNNGTSATGIPFTVSKNGTDKFTINDAGEATGVKFIKSGGTSSQFLKADGSVDSSTYALTSQLHDAVTLGTTGVLNGLSLSGQVLSLATASSTTRGALTAEDYSYFFGKQNALTNPVTGTGTTNYIPKFTGASALGNSNITDNGTVVAIITDATINGVNIGRGGGAIATNTRVGTIALNSNTTGSGNSAFGISALNANTTGGSNIAIGRAALEANTTGTTNTAVGTFSLLSNISGSNNVSLGFNSGRFIADGTTANTISNTSIFIGVSTKALADNQTNQIVIGNNAVGLGSNTTVLGNSSTTTTAIYGNLGIGTTSPNINNYTRALTVLASSGYAGIEVYGGSTTAGAQIDFGGGTDRFASISGEYESATNGYLNIRTRRAGSMENAMRITSGGNVGIGTTNASGRLTLNNPISDGSVPLISIRDTSNVYEIGYLNFNQSTDMMTLMNKQSYSASGISLGTNNTERMRITSGGNVGIGTPSPTDGKLQVAGNTQLGNTIAQTYFGVGAAATKVTSNGSWAIGVDAADGSTERMRITSGGNVGIGVTVPNAKLEVGGNAIFNSGLNSTDGIKIISSLSSSLFTGGIEFIRTTVSGGSKIQPLRDASAGGVGMSLLVTANNAAEISGTYSNAVTILPSGNVGIGTASPSVKLQVESSDVAAFIKSSGNPVPISIFNSGSTVSTIGFKGSTTANEYNVRVGADAENFVAYTSDTERMRITSGGNVLIGTTTDAGYKLDVNGTGRFLDNLTVNKEGGIIGIDASNNPRIGFVKKSGEQPFLAFASDPFLLKVSSGSEIFASNTFTTVLSIATSGAATFSNTVTATGFFNSSDNRLKDLIEYDYNVSDIKPITYLWKDGRDNKKHVGYSAQEVQKVMPDAVNEGTDGMLSVNYVEILVAKISQMEKEIAYLKSKI